MTLLIIHFTHFPRIMDWRSGSNGREPALQAQSTELKTQSYQKTNKQTKTKQTHKTLPKHTQLGSCISLGQLQTSPHGGITELSLSPDPLSSFTCHLAALPPCPILPPSFCVLVSQEFTPTQHLLRPPPQPPLHSGPGDRLITTANMY
jgi:hypothetical protein